MPSISSKVRLCHDFGQLRRSCAIRLFYQWRIPRSRGLNVSKDMYYEADTGLLICLALMSPDSSPESARYQSLTGQQAAPASLIG